MVGEVMAYALLHAASPKLATVVALGDRDRPHVVLARDDADQPGTEFNSVPRAINKRFGNMPQARIASKKK